MFKKIVSFGMLSLGSVWASSSTSDSTANLAESSPSQHVWTIQGIETAGVTAADVRGKFATSQDLEFKLLEHREGSVFPSLAYDLSNYHESYLPPMHLRDAWDAAYLNNHHVAAHGFSSYRLRGIFESYFSEIAGSKPLDLSAQQLLDLAPFCALELRNSVASCLVDLRNNQHHVAYVYGLGFLYKVPKECIHISSNKDSDSPYEGSWSIKAIRSHIEDLPNVKYSHQELLDMLTPAQRAQYLEDGNDAVTEMQIRTHNYRPVTDYWTELMNTRPELKDLPKRFMYKWGNFTPSELVSSVARRENLYNEVAFVSRVSHPHKEARIVGVYYTSLLTGFGKERKPNGTSEIKDPLSRDQTIAALKVMAEKMGVPLVELK